MSPLAERQPGWLDRLTGAAIILLMVLMGLWGVLLLPTSVQAELPARLAFAPSGAGEILAPARAVLAGLSMTKSVNVGTVVRGMPFTYTILIANTDVVTCDTLILTDTLPADFHYVPGSGNPSDPDIIAEPLLVWQNLGPLAAGGSVNVTFAVTATAANGSHTNNAETTGDHVGGVFTATAAVPIDIVDPSITLRKGIAGAGAMDHVITFTISIRNMGPSTINWLPMRDDFTPPLSYLASVPFADTVFTNSVRWNDLTTALGDLAPGAFIEFDVAFSITIPAETFTATNTAMVAGAFDEFGNLIPVAQYFLPINNAPTAVELLYFRALPLEDGARLEWATAVEIDNFGFNIYRMLDEGLPRMDLVGFVPSEAHGGGATYVYVDATPGDGLWWYWLADVDTNGVETFQGLAGVVVSAGAYPHKLFLPLVVR